MLGARARDLAVEEDDYEEGNDRWKPDVDACWTYAGSTHLYAESKPVLLEEITARREFWRWYLLVAVPLAMGNAPLELIELAPRRWAVSQSIGSAM
jgi:hypothetical protein